MVVTRFGERADFRLSSSLKPQDPSLAGSGRRAGMSLVELMVVMAIIGGLVGLLLPAVQQSREVARRAHCLNNLRQIGVGLHLYHEVYASFPIGCLERRIGPVNTKRQIAWSAWLLPYVEQQALYRSLDLSTPFDSPKNAAGAATIVPVYVCPSVDRIAQATSGGRGPCDYGGIYGPRFHGELNSPPRGVMLYGAAVTLPMITDGASNTLAIAEESIFLPAGEWINGMNVFDVSYAINMAPAIDNDIHSQHPGGANGLLVDGSARFLSEGTSTDVLSAICTRSDSEIVDAW
jgi:prepilin-type N-terminal cleavage/methylation domain-containing protein/prepilin-type processing-associated H-X9-DG protein